MVGVGVTKIQWALEYILNSKFSKNCHYTVLSNIPLSNIKTRVLRIKKKTTKNTKNVQEFVFKSCLTLTFFIFDTRKIYFSGELVGGIVKNTVLIFFNSQKKAIEIFISATSSWPLKCDVIYVELYSIAWETLFEYCFLRPFLP